MTWEEYKKWCAQIGLEPRDRDYDLLCAMNEAREKGQILIFTGGRGSYKVREPPSCEDCGTPTGSIAMSNCGCFRNPNHQTDVERLSVEGNRPDIH